MTLGAAIQTLLNAGFTVDPVILWAYSASVGYYEVISQNPAAGSDMNYQQTPIQLTVSMGLPPESASIQYVTDSYGNYVLDSYGNRVISGTGFSPPITMVPTLTGLTLLPAMESLLAAQLNLGTVTYLQSDDYDVNEVTSQSAAAGSQVTPFTTVNLAVCSGPPYINPFGEQVQVPDVVG